MGSVTKIVTSSKPPKYKKTPISHQKRLMSYAECAAEYGGTVWSWRTAVWSRELPYVEFAGKHFLDRADVEALIAGKKRYA